MEPEQDYGGGDYMDVGDDGWGDDGWGDGNTGNTGKEE